MSNPFVIRFNPAKGGFIDFNAPSSFNFNNVTISGYNATLVNGSTTIFAFTSTTSISNAIVINNANNLNLQIFAVGGGGSGGCDQSAGGGAGGVLQQSYKINGTDYVSLSIGAGGVALASPNLGVTGGNTTVTFATNTGNSITCYGGGGGASYAYDANLNSSGTVVANCGSGGGGSGYQSKALGAGTVGQGNSGGAGNGQGINGGGGGAGTAGIAGASPNSGAGGTGVQINTSLLSYFTGSTYANYWWAGGGGGGGTMNSCNAGNGGKGGGGGGSSDNSTSGLGDTNGINAGGNGQVGLGKIGGAGGANTGGGGGGAAHTGGYIGGPGGSGIILVAVPTAALKVLYYLPTDPYLVRTNITVAFSMRLLFSAYTGPIINVRRSSDNATQDFYSDTLQTYLTTGFGGTGTNYSDWIGANTGYITKWYDQSPNANHATNTTNSTSQPTLVQQTNNGVTKWVMYYQNANSSYLTSATAIAPNTIFCHFNTSLVSGIFTILSAASDYGMRFINSSNYNYFFNASPLGAGNDWYMAAGGTKLAYNNNTDISSTAAITTNVWEVLSVSASTAPGTTMNYVGASGAFLNSRGLNGYMTELICHNTSMAASNMQSFYNNRLF